MGRLRSRPRLPALPPLAGDLLLALALTSVAQLEIWLTLESREPAVVAAATLMTATIALRRHAPLFTVSVSAAALAAQSLLTDAADAPLAQFVTFFVAVYSVAAHCAPRRALFGGIAGLAAAWIATAREHGSGADEYAYVTLLVAGAWVSGWALRGRRLRASALEELADALDREREEKARAAVAEERTRIARELHDIVSHSISVIAVQTQAVRRRLGPGQEREIEDLRAVETTARQAMAEMRRLFGVLRADRDQLSLAPQPGLGQLGRLLEQAQAAGLPVELRVEGEAVALPPGVDLAAYRVVQEALTNTLKHAGRARATVVVRYRDPELELEVEDDGAGVSPDGSDGGHGLVGMRERVALYGGVLETGDRPGGGFRVWARLPFRERESP
jgi:signal transduction histidine kinase